MGSDPWSDPDLRLFFALWPDAMSRAALARLALEVAHEAQGRAPRSENLHVTLAFVGEVSWARADALLAVGRSVAALAAPFPLALDRVGGTARGLAWLAPLSLPERLQRLERSLSEALVASGFALQQRRFRPHVTLARDCARTARRGGVTPIEWQVAHLSLVASTLARGGSEYRDLDRWPLSGDQSTGTV